MLRWIKLWLSTLAALLSALATLLTALSATLLAASTLLRHLAGRPVRRLADRLGHLGRLADLPDHLAVDLSSVFPPVNRRIVVDVKPQPPIDDSVPNRGLNFTHVYSLEETRRLSEGTIFHKGSCADDHDDAEFPVATPASAHD
jgi:hypothetical protein